MPHNLYGQDKNPPHLDTALTYVGVTELTNNNDGPEVEMFLKSVGRVKGNAWCAAYVGYALNVNPQVVNPPPNSRTGLARHYESRSQKNLVIDAKDVLQGTKTIPKGSIVTWQKQNTVFGHTGFVREEWSGKYGKTVEGNTSSGNHGSQSDGDGVYLRDRSINPGNYFRIRWFTLVTYEPPIYYPINIEPKPLTTIQTLERIWNIITLD